LTRNRADDCGRSGENAISLLASHPSDKNKDVARVDGIRKKASAKIE